jgi:hypothetical protein
MAIKKSIETASGIRVEYAYNRVENVQIISKNNMQFQVRSSLDGVKPHFYDVSYTCVYDITGDNPIKQAYEHLKTLEEFAGCIDC